MLYHAMLRNFTLRLLLRESPFTVFLTLVNFVLMIFEVKIFCALVVGEALLSCSCLNVSSEGKMWLESDFTDQPIIKGKNALIY